MNISTELIFHSLIGFLALIGGLLLFVVKNRKEIIFLCKNLAYKPNLKNHFIFFELTSWRDYQIEYYINQVPDKLRAELAKKFLYVRITVKEEYYKNLVKLIETEKLTFSLLLEEKAKMEEKFSLKATEAGIPDIVIKKFKFQNTQTDLTDFYLYERILNYKHFNTDEEKLSAIFCVDLKNLYKVGVDLPQIIMSFNGELDEYFVKQGMR
ncbi:MAG TPA: hypothetical protein PK138_01740 [Candidatus Paceibacterota bacterium]|nr:hypothetical protein [Candidatus Paceibacterota bacterium]